MKKRLRLIFSIVTAVLMLASSATALVSAESTVGNTTGSGENTGSAPPSTPPVKTPSADPKLLGTRLALYKTEFRVNLTSIEQTTIKTRCKLAQGGGITLLEGRIKSIETNRIAVHANLLDNLNKLVAKLKTKGIDTAKLESEIAVLKGKTDTFKTDMDTYIQDVTDLKAMDCATDPTAFKSALLATRAEHDKLLQEAIDIRAYINNTIKPTLKDIRSQLKPPTTTPPPATPPTNQTQNTTGGN